MYVSVVAQRCVICSMSSSAPRGSRQPTCLDRPRISTSATRLPKSTSRIDDDDGFLDNQHIFCPRPNGALSDLRKACQRDKYQQTSGLRMHVLHRRTLSAANTGQTKDRELLLYTSCEKIRQPQGLAVWIIAAHQWRQQHSANSLHEASCAAVFLDPACEWLQTSCFRRGCSRWSTRAEGCCWTCPEESKE
jgi:hypothetical protein